jgi:hypothetical protein
VGTDAGSRSRWIPLTVGDGPCIGRAGPVIGTRQADDVPSVLQALSEHIDANVERRTTHAATIALLAWKATVVLVASSTVHATPPVADGVMPTVVPAAFQRV